MKGHPGDVVCGGELYRPLDQLPHGLSPTDRPMRTPHPGFQSPWSILGEGLLPLVATLDATIGRCVRKIQPDGTDIRPFAFSLEVAADTERRPGERLVRRRGDLCRLDASAR